ncbi:MAG: hypothetical protein KDJ35_04670 [Alphaproteobacteria bacterium]|nr:hypothetical protein [Alphaproteobacteria bacterium]
MHKAARSAALFTSGLALWANMAFAQSDKTTTAPANDSITAMQADMKQKAQGRGGKVTEESGRFDLTLTSYQLDIITARGFTSEADAQNFLDQWLSGADVDYPALFKNAESVKQVYNAKVNSSTNSFISFEQRGNAFKQTLEIQDIRRNALYVRGDFADTASVAALFKAAETGTNQMSELKDEIDALLNNPANTADFLGLGNNDTNYSAVYKDGKTEFRIPGQEKSISYGFYLPGVFNQAYKHCFEKPEEPQKTQRFEP